MKDISIIEFIKMKLKKRKEKKKVLLTIEEAIKYKTLKYTNMDVSIRDLLFPFYFFFYGSIFILVMDLVWQIDLRVLLLAVTSILLKLWFLVILVLLGILLADTISNSRYNKRLLQTIVKERKK